MSDRVAGMYLGQIVEVGEAQHVLDSPRPPSTQLLMKSIPRLDGVPANTELLGNRKLPGGVISASVVPWQLRYAD
ncbi:hypothetical protein [Rosenbergiella epipactidis]|uniref:hypothetical protein n=1 Tax=Rosenbergiella epipactidis TaxID=1544694 RepID=UPI003B96F915